jgi:hypothetical protein
VGWIEIISVLKIISELWSTFDMGP